MGIAGIRRLLRAAGALARARQQERERSALWPIEPAVEASRGVFASQAMQEIVATARKAAATDLIVLITGETGTGKEVVARVMHDACPQAKGPFLAFNCSAVPRDMLDSQLFGHRRGAFTGAVNSFEGVIRAAAGGTLFLDEIGELSPEVQPKLLRFLESGEIQPLGEAQPVRCKVRVIAATNADIDQFVAAGRFREDLFYRINGIRLRLPPLRERREDIPLLVDHFIARFNRLRGRDVSGLSPETLQILVNHDYPGNVRELEHVIEHAFILCPGGMIQREHLPEALRVVEAAPERAGTGDLRDLEARFLQETLRRHGWNRAAVAKELGIHKTTLWRKIKQFGLSLPDR
jgi:transcriptional regulator with PAS, ATPase and Fis domain